MARRTLTPTWRALLRTAALLNVAVLVVAGLIIRDPEALVLGGVTMVALTMIRFRTGLAGAIILGAVLANTAAWMAPAAAANLLQREDLAATMIPITLTVIGVAGVAAAVGALFIPQPSARVAALVPQVLIAVFVIASIGALIQARGDAINAPQPGDIVFEMGSLTFDPSAVEVTAGSITLAATNTDLFWHTFTIDELGVNLAAPTGASRRATVTVTPGTYDYYCAVIGHRAAGMEGTLTVKEG